MLLLLATILACMLFLAQMFTFYMATVLGTSLPSLHLIVFYALDESECKFALISLLLTLNYIHASQFQPYVNIFFNRLVQYISHML